MKKLVHKSFPVWNFDAEEKWLNKMADEGWALTSVGWRKYEFEACQPGKYIFRSEYIADSMKHPESDQYVEFIEDAGAEMVCSRMRWVYFRKKTADGAFELYSDNKSKIRYIDRLMLTITPFTLLCIYYAIYDMVQLYTTGLWAYVIGLVPMAAAIICARGLVILLKKKRRLKKESRVYE